jgi:hypothetical protein
MDEIINNYNITLAECLNHYQNGDKGMIRSTMGAMVENWVNGIFNNINSQYENRGEIRKGESDRIPITNSFGTTIGMQVDRHIYVDNKLKAVIEMIRANDDIGRIKKYKSDVKGYILVLENAVSAIAEKFILEEGILDNVFYLTHGKRSPVKQIWLPENHKALNVGVLESFYNTIQSLYEN